MAHHFYLVFAVIIYLLIGGIWLISGLEYYDRYFGLKHIKNSPHALWVYTKTNWNSLSVFGKIVWCIGLPGYALAFTLFMISYAIVKFLNIIRKLMKRRNNP